MKRLTERFLLLCLLALPVAAQEIVTVKCYKLESVQCDQLAQKLSAEASKFPIHNWEWLLLGEDGWREFEGVVGEKRISASANVAATLPKDRRTFVRADWLAKAEFHEMVSVVAHEYGHVTCRTKDERRADECGTELLIKGGHSWSVVEHLAKLRARN